MNKITYNIDLHKTDKQRMHGIKTNCGKQKDFIWQMLPPYNIYARIFIFIAIYR